jgi:hypothetical protein
MNECFAFFVETMKVFFVIFLFCIVSHQLSNALNEDERRNVISKLPAELHHCFEGAEVKKDVNCWRLWRFV